MVWVKSLDSGDDWAVGHSAMGWTKYLKFNATEAASTYVGIWNDTAPSSTLVTIGNNSIVNTQTTRGYIMYAFAEKKGYSDYGAYTGNGDNDGPFVYTGFRPAWILIKGTENTWDWELYDDKRVGYNASGGNKVLQPNNTSGEATEDIDILSNGFKIRDSGNRLNSSTNQYIYAAFAEFPIVSSNDIPVVAR